MALQDLHQFLCPHCWQTIEVTLELSAGRQRYIQDCEVCCNPLEISYEIHEGAVSGFNVRSIDQ